MRLELNIVSPEGPVVRDTIDALTVPDTRGEITILPGHRPIITILRPGTVTITKGEAQDHYAIGGGFMEVHRDRITLTADVAEHCSQIDVPRAMAAKKRAAETLAQVDPPQEADLERAMAALERARARIHTAGKVKPEK